MRVPILKKRRTIGAISVKKHTELMTLPQLWQLFGDIPINNDDEIEEDFLCFPVGTYRFDVWHWFDERCPNGLAVDLMGEKSKYHGV